MIRFSNRASALLVAPLAADGIDVVLEAGKGDLFPDVSGGDYAPAMLAGIAGTTEIVHVTGKAGDHLTVNRGQEGTAQSTWGAGDRIELRLTAGVLDQFLQKSGGLMTGALDMGDHEILNAVFPSGIQNFDTVAASRYRGDPAMADNQLVIPATGERPTIGGSIVLTAAMLSAAIFQWSGALNELPSYFQLCDGTNGTPDLRDRFIVGQGPRHALGSASATTDPAIATDAAGQHDHGGKTGAYALVQNDLPAGPYITDVYASGFTDLVNDSMIMARGSDRGLHIDYFTSAGNRHFHSISGVDAHQHQVNVTPPYYALAFVKFKAGI